MAAWGAAAGAATRPEAFADIVREQQSGKQVVADGRGASRGEAALAEEEELARVLKLSMAEYQGESQERERNEGSPREEGNQVSDFELALQLQEREDREANNAAKQGNSNKEQEDSDLALAMQLQEEEEEEGRAAKRAQYKYPQGKVSVVQRPTDDVEATEPPPRILYSAEDAETLQGDNQGEEEGVPMQKAAWQPPWPVRNRNLKGQGGDEEIITKHDAVLSGRRNVERANEMLPAETNAGNLRAHKTTLSNKVLNSLQYSLKKQRNTTKGLGRTVERDMIQTHSKGLDQKTRLVLLGLINTSFLEQVHGVVKRGKEALVLSAFGKLLSREDSLDPALVENTPVQEVAVKVFKTTLTEFKNRLDYVHGDHRFRSISNLSHQNPRKVVTVWAEKEFKNLSRVSQAGIPCPGPLKLAQNVIVMQFVGENGVAAKQLREVSLSVRRAEQCYIQVVLMMQALLARCKLVHADLSEFNILYLRKTCYLIDFGQAVLMDHPKARDFLAIDCKNVTRFFDSRGVEDTVPAEQLLLLLFDSLGQGSFDDVAALQTEGDADGARADSKTESDPLIAYARKLGPWASLEFAKAICECRSELKSARLEALSRSRGPSDVGT